MNSVSVTIGGVTYASQSEAARALGRSINAVKRAVKSGRHLASRGRRHGEVSDSARGHGLEPMTVLNRMSRGATLEEALALPQWAELPQIAARVGPKSTLIRRAVASGMSLEQALLTMPLRDRRVAA